MSKAQGTPQIATETPSIDPKSVEHHRKGVEVNTLSPGKGPKFAPRAYLRRRQPHDEEEAGVSSFRAERPFRVRMEPSKDSNEYRAPPSQT